MGSLSKSKDRSQQSTSVWDQMAPFLTDLYSRGQELSNQFKPQGGMFDQAQQAWGQQLNPQGNPFLDQMAGNFQNQLGIMNQQSGGQAALTQGFGGGRHGVAESLNTQNMSQQMGNFYGGQYQADQNRALGALGMGGSVLGMSPQNQQMQNLSQYGGLIGSPVTVGQGTSSGGSKGGSFLGG